MAHFLKRFFDFNFSFKFLEFFHLSLFIPYAWKNHSGEGSFRFFRYSWISEASFKRFIIWVSLPSETSIRFSVNRRDKKNRKAL